MELKKGVKAFLATSVWCVSMFSAPSALAASGDWNVLLQNGSQGNQVVVLQEDLRELGYFTYPTNTGYYGEITEQAVKAFQKDHGIEVNGKVGPTTGNAIEQELKAKGLTDNRGAKVVAIAKQYLGAPYAEAGTSPSGFDCSGYVQYVFKQQGIQLPRTSQDMYALGTAVTDLKPGDLVFFSTYAPGASHVGIYVGNNQFISSTTSYGVKIDSFSNVYWGPRYIGAKRVL